MYTTAQDLLAHLATYLRIDRYNRIMGIPPKQWPTPNYVKLLQARARIAESQEAA